MEKTWENKSNSTVHFMVFHQFPFHHMLNNEDKRQTKHKCPSIKAFLKIQYDHYTKRMDSGVSLHLYTTSKYCTTQNPGSVDGHWSVVTSAIPENVFCDAASCTVMRKGILPSRLLGFCRLMFTRSHQKFSTDYKSK